MSRGRQGGEDNEVGPIILMLAAGAAPLCTGVREPIVDEHLHSHDDDPRFKARVPNPGTGGPMIVADGKEQASATVAALRAAGVVRGIVGGESRATDDRMIALDPDRLRGGVEIDKIPTAADLAEIRKRHAAGKLAMIGEVDYQYNGIRHDDTRLEPLWALAEELQIPIAVHSGAGPSGIVGGFNGWSQRLPRTSQPAFDTSRFFWAFR